MEPPPNNTRTLELDDGSKVEVVEGFSKVIEDGTQMIEYEIHYGEVRMIGRVPVGELKWLSGHPGETQEAFVEGLAKVVFENFHQMMRAAVADN